MKEEKTHGFVAFQTIVLEEVKKNFKSEAAKRGLTMAEATRQALINWSDGKETKKQPELKCSHCGDQVAWYYGHVPFNSVCAECHDSLTADEAGKEI